MRSTWLVLGGCASLSFVVPAVSAQEEDASVERPEPTKKAPTRVKSNRQPVDVASANFDMAGVRAGTSDGPTVDTSDGNPDETPNDTAGDNSDDSSRRQPDRTTDDTSDGTSSKRTRDGTRRQKDKDPTRDKTQRSSHDGGSSNVTGAAAAAAAIITGVAIAVSQQRKQQQLEACEEQLRSLHGQSIGDAISALDPSEYVVHERSRVPGPADGNIAQGTVLDSEVRKIRDGKCVVTLVYAESPANLAPEEPLVEDVTVAAEPDPEPAPRPAPRPIQPAPVKPTVVAQRPREPARPTEPPACRTPIEVVSFVGGMRANAATWIEPYNLRLIETWVPSTRPEGEVLQQRPDAPAQLRCGAELELTLSDGTLVLVPAVTTLAVDRARTLISGADLVADAADSESDRSPGEVLEQSPAAGSEVPRGSTVRIAVATGLLVPDVTGLGLIAALQRLQAFHAVPTVIDSELDKDIIAGQSPVGGTRAAAGSRVALDVSAGPWLPAWLPWLLLAALIALAGAALRSLLPRLVHASARLDTDGGARAGREVAAEGPSLQVDAHLERGSSRVLFPGEPA